MTIEVPPGLKPTTFFPRNGTAEAVPFQSHGLWLLHWNPWALLPLALACAAMASPYLLTHGYLIGLALRQGFALVCHQRPERSFWILGGSVAVCSRCLGVYLGAAVGLLFQTTTTVAVRLLAVVAGLNLFDAASELAGLHGNWPVGRFALGVALGAAALLLISSSTRRETQGKTGAYRTPLPGTLA